MSEFSINFWPNFLADLVVGVGITLLINGLLKKRDKEERERVRNKEEERKSNYQHLGELNKVIVLYRYIAKKLEENISEIENFLMNTEDNKICSFGKINTGFWESVKGYFTWNDIVEPEPWKIDLLIEFISLASESNFISETMIQTQNKEELQKLSAIQKIILEKILTLETESNIIAKYKTDGNDSYSRFVEVWDKEGVR